MLSMLLSEILMVKALSLKLLGVFILKAERVLFFETEGVYHIK